MATSDDSLKAFASRPWAEIERLKDRYWAEVDMTPTARLRIAEKLRRYTLSVRPDWPDDRARKSDLEMHIRIARELSMIGNG